jgi:hypothetical protein
MFFYKLNRSLDCTLFVRADSKAEESGVNLLTVIGDVDSCTRSWNAFDANKNVHD